MLQGQSMSRDQGISHGSRMRPDALPAQSVRQPQETSDGQENA